MAGLTVGSTLACRATKRIPLQTSEASTSAVHEFIAACYFSGLPAAATVAHGCLRQILPIFVTAAIHRHKLMGASDDSRLLKEAPAAQTGSNRSHKNSASNNLTPLS